MSPKASISFFRNWTFEINQKLTKCIYTNILCGKASSARESVYQSYILHREKLFPKEILDLFEELGIDMTKDHKISHRITDNGQICIDGNFQFIGNFVSGDCCKIELTKDYTLFELTPITDNFSIGFHQDEAPFFNQHVIHLEFSVTMPQRVRSVSY